MYTITQRNRLGRGRVLATSWSSDSRYLSVVSTSGLWRYSTNGEFRLISLFRSNEPLFYLDAVYSPEGDLIALSDGNGAIHLWDASAGQRVALLEGENDGWGAKAAFSKDGKILAVSLRYGDIHLWDMSSKARIQVLTSEKGFASQRLFFTPDNAKLLSAGFELRLWDLTTGLHEKLLSARPAQWAGYEHADLDQAMLSPDGKWIATTGSIGHNVYLWDITSGERLLIAESRHASDVVFSPDSKTLAFSSDANSVTLVEVATRQQQIAANQHRSHIGGLTISPDNTRIISADFNDTVNVWDRNSEHLPLVVENIGYQILGFSPNGSFLALINHFHDLVIWEPVSGNKSSFSHGHASTVHESVISPDESTLSTAGDDHTARLWDIASGEQLGRVHVFGGDSPQFVFSPDGKLLASTILSPIMRHLGTYQAGE